ncbi:hypothetical protein HPB50_014036 [Hyalomma asiaticum]|uniref:Uncharacterized protein n=1 Tax=Hyalomma asiaticum TaxID=266040 RepID=A0ACB7TK94_HYAAI|nr:hypothetical protein HPB50_014036 [Hyalomma asiaticum]
MASSTNSFLGDRAVKDAQGVGASGGPAVSHRLDAPAAAHGRLLSELKKLLVVAPKTPSPEETTGLNMRDNSPPSRPRSYYDGPRTSTPLRPPGESAKRFPPLTKPVPSSSCRQRADVQALVTLRGPCSVHGATAEGRQAAKYNKAANSVRQSGLVCRLVNRFNKKASLQDNQVRAAVNVWKKAPSGILCDTPSAGDAQSRELEGKTEQKEDRSQNWSGDTSCQGEEDSSSHLPSLEEHWQSMHKVVAHVNETVDEMTNYIQDNQVRDVLKKAPSSSLSDTPPAGDAQNRDVSETKTEQKEELSQNCSGDTSCEGEESSFHHLSFEESRQRVREALARVTETLDEMIHDASNIFPTKESFGTGQSPASPMPKPSDSSALLNLILQLNQDAVDARTNEQVLEEDYDDSLYPLISSRRCIVIDEIDAINERIQLEWDTAYAKSQASLNSRLRQALADYRGCPGDDVGVPHEGLPTNTTEARRKLVTDLRADLQEACADFDKWRTEYMQSVFQNLCAALNRRQRLWVLGQILREEIFVSVAVFERRIRTRVAALWKKLVVRRELDLHA